MSIVNFWFCPLWAWKILLSSKNMRVHFHTPNWERYKAWMKKSTVNWVNLTYAEVVPYFSHLGDNFAMGWHLAGECWESLTGLEMPLSWHQGPGLGWDTNSRSAIGFLWGSSGKRGWEPWPGLSLKVIVKFTWNNVCKSVLGAIKHNESEVVLLQIYRRW